MANPADITTDTTVYPSRNAIETTQFEGSRGLEESHAVYAQNWVGNHIDAGLTFVSSAGLDITYAAGSGVINGRRFATDNPNAVTLADNTTNHIFIQFLFDGSNNTLTVRLISNTTGTPPSASAKIGVAVTAAGVVTSNFDMRLIDPYRTALITGQSLNNIVNSSTPADTIGIAGAGDTTIWSILVPKGTSRYTAKYKIDWSYAMIIDQSAAANVAWTIKFKINAATDRTINGSFFAADANPRSRPGSLFHVFTGIDPEIDNTFIATGSATAGGANIGFEDQEVLITEVG